MNGTSQALEHIHGKSVAYRVTWTWCFPGEYRHRFTRNGIGRILLPKKYFNINTPSIMYFITFWMVGGGPPQLRQHGYFNYGFCPILLLQLVPTMLLIVVPGWLVKCVMRA